MPKPSRSYRRAAAALLLVAPWLLIHSPALGQDPDAPVFAIIDIQKVLRESTAVKALTRELEERRAKYQAELRKKEEELRKADQELARQRTILSAEAFAEKRDNLERQVATLQREVQEQKRGLDQAFAKGMAQVQGVLAKVATEIAKERDLDLILTKATVVIVKPEIEVTNEALKRLNARLPNIAASVPQN